MARMAMHKQQTRAQSVQKPRCWRAELCFSGNISGLRREKGLRFRSVVSLLCFAGVRGTEGGSLLVPLARAHLSVVIRVVESAGQRRTGGPTHGGRVIPGAPEELARCAPT